MKRKHKSYLALAALLLISATGYAEGDPEDSFALKEVVVTATKTAKDIKDIPSAVQVITRQTIEEQGAQTLKDVLRYATGINLVRTSTSSTREAVSIRGFDSRFSMILIDGKRVASEIDQNYELDRISLDNIERIEIVRGPVSSLYGTEALGGVINIITKKSDKQSLLMNIGSGQNGTERYNFAFDSGKLGKVSVTLSGSQLENGALYKSNGLTFTPFGTRKNLNAAIDYRLSDTETVTLSQGYSQEDTHEYVKPAVTGPVMKFHDYVERDEYSLAYNRKNANQDLFLRFYQSVMDKSLNQYIASSNVLQNWVKAKRTVNVYEGRLTQTLNAKHRLTIGGEYRPEVFRGTAVNTHEGYFTAVHESGQTKQGSTAHLNYRAAYAQDEWDVTDKLIAVTALRYDDSNKFESNLSPKLGLTYKVDSNTRIKVNAAEGFRSPTPNQLYQSASTQQGNPNLVSEKSKSYDLSVEKDWGKTSSKLTFFTNKVSNMIDLVTLSGTDKQYQNISKASLQGIEAEVTQQLSDRLAWSNSYTYLDAINDVTHQKLQSRARHMLTSGLSYHNNQGFTANLQAQLFDDYLIYSGKEKSYVLWNLAMTKKLSSQYKVAIGVDNIFNKKDEDVPVVGSYIHGSVQYAF